MSLYRDQVQAALRAVTLTRTSNYSWMGRPGRLLPAWLRDELTAEERRAFLLGCVSGELYASFYCRGRVEPARWREPHPHWTDARFVGSLVAADVGRGVWEDGWVVERESDEGVVAHSARRGLRVRAPVVDGAPGDRVTLRFPSVRPALSPGFVTLIGDAGDADAADVIRVYWHVSAAGAVELVEALTGRLSAETVPYRLKVLSHPLSFDRCDGAVLYLGAAEFASLRTVLRSIATGLTAVLRPRVPVFTLALSPGVGLAEDPSDGESFGERRCALLAEGALDAYSLGARGLRARTEAVAARFDAAGVDLDTPYRDPSLAGRHVL